MTIPKAGGCYKRLPGGAVVPADQVLAVAPAPKAASRKTRTNPTPPADTVPAALGDTVAVSETQPATGGE